MLQSSESMCVCERYQKLKELSARQAMTSMSDLVNLVRRNSDFDGATVFLHKKTKSVPWRSAVSPTGLGDRVIRTDGLIGGLLSKVAASVVLSQEERECTENDQKNAHDSDTTSMVIDGRHCMLQKVCG